MKCTSSTNAISFRSPRRLDARRRNRRSRSFRRARPQTEMSPGAWRRRYARRHAPEGPRDVVRLFLLDEGPRARVRGEAHHRRVPGAFGPDDARSPRDPGPHTRRRGELARAAARTARRGVEEGVAAKRLPDSEGAHRPLAARRAGDARLARIVGRREARADPRSRAWLAAERALSALVLRAAHPYAYPTAARRRGSSVDADAAVAGEHRVPRVRRFHPPRRNAPGRTLPRSPRTAA